MSINREKILTVLAGLVFLTCMASFVKQRLRPRVEYRPISTEQLNDSRQEVLSIEPRTHKPSDHSPRDPFKYSSGWNEIRPEVMPGPPLFEERRPRATFGWLAERGVGASLSYEKHAPVLNDGSKSKGRKKERPSQLRGPGND